MYEQRMPYSGLDIVSTDFPFLRVLCGTGTGVCVAGWAAFPASVFCLFDRRDEVGVG